METKNCLTCRWEPEWEPYMRGHLGECRYPLPITLRPPAIRRRLDGSIREIVTNTSADTCLAYQPKNAAVN